MQAFVSSGTNFTLQFPKGEDGTVLKDSLDFDREPGKVRTVYDKFCFECVGGIRENVPIISLKIPNLKRNVIYKLPSCFEIWIFSWIFPLSSILRQFFKEKAGNTPELRPPIEISCGPTEAAGKLRLYRKINCGLCRWATDLISFWKFICV